MVLQGHFRLREKPLSPAGPCPCKLPLLCIISPPHFCMCHWGNFWLFGCGPTAEPTNLFSASLMLCSLLTASCSSATGCRRSSTWNTFCRKVCTSPCPKRKVSAVSCSPSSALQPPPCAAPAAWRHRPPLGQTQQIRPPELQSSLSDQRPPLCEGAQAGRELTERCGLLGCAHLRLPLGRSRNAANRSASRAAAPRAVLLRRGGGWAGSARGSSAPLGRAAAAHGHPARPESLRSAADRARVCHSIVESFGLEETLGIIQSNRNLNHVPANLI